MRMQNNFFFLYLVSQTIEFCNNRNISESQSISIVTLQVTSHNITLQITFIRI